jgi:two-component system sporulation sensor kinase B
MCFIANISIGYFEESPRLKKWVHAFIGGVAIVISLLFGNQIHNGIIFDLRQIPFIFVSLMEGPVVSFSLLGVLILTRLLIGGHGVLSTVIIYSLATLSIIKLGPVYLKGSFSRKLLICLSLSFFCSFFRLLYIQNFDNPFFRTKELWLSYLLIPSIGTALLLSISEGIKKYFLLKKEIYKAEKAQVVSHLAASFGHEVRNPISVSRGFLQLLAEDDISSEKRRQYAKTAIDELDHAERIIHSYLTFAKPQFEKKEHLNFCEEINKAVEIVLPMAKMNHVTIDLVPFPELPKGCVLEGDRSHLHQCLLNLLKNAIEAMPNGGELKLAVFALEKTIGVRISDTGNGMTKDQLKRLGEPYFSTKEKGTGLGIMVVYSIVKAMHGKIDVESETGKGTTFTLMFPLISFPEIKKEVG